MNNAVIRRWMIPGPRPARPVRIALVGGDGIGPEVVGATATCLAELRIELELLRPAHGRETVKTLGDPCPATFKEAVRGADAVLFGAADGAGGVCAPILWFLRRELDTYANIRPSTHLPAFRGRDGTDLVIVRELSEGLYPAREGTLDELRAQRLALPAIPEGPGAFAVRIISEAATRRVAKRAAELALHRGQHGGRGEICIVTKANVLKRTDGLFLEVSRAAIHEAAPGITMRHLHVDEAARQLVLCPEKFDVVLTSNLFGDILSDVACEAAGGIGLAPSASLGRSSAYFEPCHGSAPDLVGKDFANPTATLLSAAMLLAHVGHPDAAERLVDAVLGVLESGNSTRDLGGSLGTTDFTRRIVERLRAG